jgi:hypothetical protein
LMVPHELAGPGVEDDQGVGIDSMIKFFVLDGLRH